MTDEVNTYRNFRISTLIILAIAILIFSNKSQGITLSTLDGINTPDRSATLKWSEPKGYITITKKTPDGNSSTLSIVNYERERRLHTVHEEPGEVIYTISDCYYIQTPLSSGSNSSRYNQYCSRANLSLIFGNGEPSTPTYWSLEYTTYDSLCIQYRSYQCVASIDEVHKHGSATFFNSADNKLDKPVVIVPPLSFEEDLTVAEIYSHINKTGLADDLRKDGYDIVIYKYENSKNGISSASGGLRILLNKLYQFKGIESTSLVGLSMGGVVARYTLLDMEAAGKPNNVSTWISYDAPHLGANIPNSIVSTLEKMKEEMDKEICGLFDNCLEGLRQVEMEIEKLSTLTAQDLLLNSPASSANARRTNLQNALYDNGYFPSIPSLAISNGTKDYGHNLATAKVLFSFRIGIDNIYDRRYWVSNEPTTDNKPGSYMDFFSLFIDQLEKQGERVQFLGGAGAKHCFIPTESALLGTQESTPFTKTLVAQGTLNEAHLEINTFNANEIKSWLKENQH